MTNYMSRCFAICWKNE